MNFMYATTMAFQFSNNEIIDGICESMLNPAKLDWNLARLI